MDVRTFSTPIKQSTTSLDSQASPLNPESIAIPGSITAYERENGKPFTVDHFQINEYLDIRKAGDVEGIIPMIQEIEQYVKDNIELRGLVDNEESYKFLMDEILDKIGMVPVEDIRRTFKRIGTYVHKNLDVKQQLELKSIQEQLSELNHKLWQTQTKY